MAVCMDVDVLCGGFIFICVIVGGLIVFVTLWMVIVFFLFVCFYGLVGAMGVHVVRPSDGSVFD